MFDSIKRTLALVIATLLLTACDNNSKNVLKVGTIAGPDAQLLEVAQKVAKEKYHLDIKIIEFTDYIEPNTALNDHSIDANMFQHQPYLDQQIKDHQYKLITIGKTFIFPMAIYASKLKNLQDLRDNAIAAIPNDPSNEGRALLLLQKAGLIELDPSAGLYATPAHIVKNPKQIKFNELDAAQLARSLPDVDFAVINSNYAILAGLEPTRDSIFHETTDSPYANIIVIREDERSDPRMIDLVAAIQSDAVLNAAKQIFNDQAIPAWQHP